MKGKFYGLLSGILVVIGLLSTLGLTQPYWLPKLAGLWLPAGVTLSVTHNGRLTAQGVRLPQFTLLAGACQLADGRDLRLGYAGSWHLSLGALTLNSACLNHLPSSVSPAQEPSLTLQQWQNQLPVGHIKVDRFTLLPWPDFSGQLALDSRLEQQRLTFHGPRLAIEAAVNKQQLTVDKFILAAEAGKPAFKMAGGMVLALTPDSFPPQGRLTTTWVAPPQGEQIDIALTWQGAQGSLEAHASSDRRELLNLPWSLTSNRLTISEGRWSWPYADTPLSGGLALQLADWSAGWDKLRLSGRANLVSQGDAGKGNAVLSFGPGLLDFSRHPFPVQLVGEIKHQQLIGYARLPGEISGDLTAPRVVLRPGALLRSRGKISEALSIDDVRLPLAGITLSSQGISGRLQAILRASQNTLGQLTLHLDGRAERFMLDSGLWQWRYWGNGHFYPLDANWDVFGSGEWRESQITLRQLSTGFDKLAYGALRVAQPRLALTEPWVWQRDAQSPGFSAGLTLQTGSVHLGDDAALPEARLVVTLAGKTPADFQFRGALRAADIGPIRVTGRWGEERLRGTAWWPQQSIKVFQPLIPPAWKMQLSDGALYGQVAFSAAAHQGFMAGGHGVVRQAGVAFPDNEVTGIDFVLPFRYRSGQWHFGTRGPVSLNIAAIRNQINVTNVQVRLQGWYPWQESKPLTLTDFSADLLEGNVMMRQLRLPQKEAGLLRLRNLSSSALVAAISPKQFTFSGRFDGALPIWLNHPQWIIKEGWLMNPGDLTFRMDKDMADAIVADNMAAGLAINWLRYLEIEPSWARVSVDNLGEMTLQTRVSALSRLQDKSSQVRLNYRQEENLFSLWRSLRFADNLQSWIEKNALLKPSDMQKTEQNHKEMR